MAGNGDERQAAAWERVEAKLDRLAERVGDHGELLALIDRRLARVEGDLELVKLLIEAVRHEVDRKTEKLKDELISALGRETRVELLAAQSLNNDRLDAIERRLVLLEAKS
jgi:hypothetical protein